MPLLRKRHSPDGAYNELLLLAINIPLLMELRFSYGSLCSLMVQRGFSPTTPILYEPPRGHLGMRAGFKYVTRLEAVTDLP